MVTLELTKHELEGCMIAFMFYWCHTGDGTLEEKVESMGKHSLFNKLTEALKGGLNDIPKR